MSFQPGPGQVFLVNIQPAQQLSQSNTRQQRKARDTGSGNRPQAADAKAKGVGKQRDNEEQAGETAGVDGSMLMVLGLG